MLGERIKVCNVTLLVSIQLVLLIYFLFSFHHASKAKIHSKTNISDPTLCTVMLKTLCSPVRKCTQMYLTDHQQVSSHL